MKTAIYIEEGVLQLVITPETDYERKVIQMFEDKPFEAEIYSGSFYSCQGGWIRQDRGDDNSLILKATMEVAEQPQTKE